MYFVKCFVSSSFAKNLKDEIRREISVTIDLLGAVIFMWYNNSHR